jgi:hypothetical protein
MTIFWKLLAGAQLMDREPAAAQQAYLTDGFWKHDTFAFLLAKRIADLRLLLNAEWRKINLCLLLFFCRLFPNIRGLYPPDETLLSLHHVPLIATVALAHWDEGISLG